MPPPPGRRRQELVQSLLERIMTWSHTDIRLLEQALEERQTAGTPVHPVNQSGPSTQAVQQRRSQVLGLLREELHRINAELANIGANTQDEERFNFNDDTQDHAIREQLQQLQTRREEAFAEAHRTMTQTRELMRQARARQAALEYVEQHPLEADHPSVEREGEEEQEEYTIEEEEEEPSQPAAAGSTRMQDLEMIANHVNVDAPPDLVELAYDRNDGDIVNTLMNLTEPAFRRQLERALAERQEEEEDDSSSWDTESGIEQSVWDEDDDHEWYYRRAREMQEEDDERGVPIEVYRRTRREDTVAELRKQMEQLEEDMENAQIDEGTYLERADELRDAYRDAKHAHTRIVYTRTVSRHGWPVDDTRVMPHRESHLMVTNNVPLGLRAHEHDETDSMWFNGNRPALSDRSWAHLERRIPTPPNEDIPEVD